MRQNQGKTKTAVGHTFMDVSLKLDFCEFFHTQLACEAALREGIGERTKEGG